MRSSGSITYEYYLIAALHLEIRHCCFYWLVVVSGMKGREHSVVPFCVGSAVEGGRTQVKHKYLSIYLAIL